MLNARFLAPLPPTRALIHPALRDVREATLSVIQAPGNRLAPESLVAVLRSAAAEPDVRWVQIAELDATPEHLGRSLERAMGDDPPLDAWAGRHPERLGSDAGAAIGETLAARLGPGAFLVIEDPLGAVPRALATSVLSGFAQARHGIGGGVVFISPRPPPSALAQRADRVIGPADLEFSGGLCPDLLCERDQHLPVDLLSRIGRVAGGRLPMLHDLLDAAGARPQGVADILARERWRLGRAGRLTRRMLADRPPEAVEALALASRFGHWHPSLDGDVERQSDLRPWLIPLEDGWHRLRPAWGPALGRALRPRVAAVPALPREATGRRSERISPPAAPAPVRPRSRSLPRPAPADGADRGRSRVRLLGPFAIEVDGQPIEHWHGQRGLLLLKYLLVQPGRSAPRDVLMETFWPDASPQQAKNRLHVAISAVRRSVRPVTGATVVEFWEGAYRISPELDPIIDADEFARLCQRGRRAEADGEMDAALSAWEEAVALYRGDLLADCPYAEWSILPRELLRLDYLDTLDRMTLAYLADDRLADCIRVAQLILQRDGCNESAHRLLMACYAEQGRLGEALRQFENCARMLRSLDATPSRDTEALHRRIRHGGALARVGGTARPS